MFDARDRMRPAADAAPRRRAGALPLLATVLAVALGASGCAGTAAAVPADPASEELTAALGEWWSLDAAGRLALLDADSRELGALLVQAAGLDEQTGLDAAAVEAALPRFVFPARPADTVAAPAAGTPAADDAASADAAEDMLDDAGLGDVDLGGLEGLSPEEIAALTPEELAELVGGGAGGGGAGAGGGYAPDAADTAPAAPAIAAAAASVVALPAGVADSAVRASRAASPVSVEGAAIDAARNMVEDLAFNLERAGASGSQSSQYSWEADGLTASSSVKDGIAVTGMQYETFDTIGDVSVVLESTMDSNVSVCPDADGRVEGQFKITGTLHSADASGAPLMTRVTMQVHLDATVNDEAWASQAGGEFIAEMETGRPTPAGEFAEVLVTQSNSGTIAVDYYSDAKGVKPGKVGVSKVRGAGPLGTVGRDIAAKVQQGALAAVQDFWRTGNCVYAQVDASPDVIDRGGSSELKVVAYPMQGQGRIPVATAEYTGVNKGTVQGTVAPGSAKPTPATYTFKAAADDGMAQPEFKVTSKRGIGFGFAVIRVGQSGWAVDWTGENGERITGLKCDGLVGTWELTGTSDYTWGGSALMEINEGLTGTITWNAEVTADQRYALDGTGPVVLEASAGGYVLRTASGELPVRKATAGECG